MHELSFESHGSKVNGLLYMAAGPGPHPTVVLLHGYPGNERNLDLAQVIRRAGTNVLYFNYRGTWGSGGEFTVPHAVEDAASALAFLRRDESSEAYRVDPDRLALIGHSFGGYVAAMTAAEDSTVRCLGFMAGVNLGMLGSLARTDPELEASLVAALGAAVDNMSGPVKGDAGEMVAELMNRAEEFDLDSYTASLIDRPVLMVAGERDAVVPKSTFHDPLLVTLRAAGGARVTELVFDDDHYFSAHRVALARGVTDWLNRECWQ
jgi:dipeptidyl aminopeptidase/acylaminoacyl peptidase